MNSNEAKTNWGTLAEIPEICVNRFGSLPPTKTSRVKDTSRAFFMTHYDREIIKDVLSKSFLDTLEDSQSECRLYLHELAFQFLKYWTTTIFVDDPNVSKCLDRLKSTGRIVFLETNRPIRLHFVISGQEEGHLDIDVTALSSGSNIGCIMLLFECLGENEKRILYTGDARVMLKDLQDNPCLHNLDGSVKKIDKIYLDTTFCLEDAKELPSRKRVIDELLAAVENDAKNDDLKHFDIWTPLKVFHLTFLEKLAKKFRQGVHVPPNMMDFLENIPEFKGLINCDSRANNRFHFDCGETCDNEFCGNGLEWAIEFDVTPVNLGCDFAYSNELPRVDPTTLEDEKQWVKNKKAVYRRNVDDLKGIYAWHFSRYEMGRFLNFFGVDPEDVVPLHLSRQMVCIEFSILLEMACADGKMEPEHLSDELPSYAFDFTNFNKSSSNTSENSQQYIHEIKKPSSLLK